MTRVAEIISSNLQENQRWNGKAGWAERSVPAIGTERGHVALCSPYILWALYVPFR